MSFTERYTKVFQYIMPSPLTIALVLTILTYFIALLYTQPNDKNLAEYSLILLDYWEKGLWQESLMVFAMQMMLILVLGHVIALSPFVNRFLNQMVKNIDNTAQAAFIVSILTIAVALFNWGLGLIFGAIFARKVGEHAQKQQLKINYPLIGAAGYIGLMVWHGGISGSSLTKVAEVAHLKQMMQGIFSAEEIAMLPQQITFSETVFSNMNIYTTVLIIILLPCVFYLIGKQAKGEIPQLQIKNNEVRIQKKNVKGAAQLDYSKTFALMLATTILFWSIYTATVQSVNAPLGFITPNYLNFVLLGLGILLHGNFHNFINAIDKSIGGAAGILIQFPFYFGIMAIMKDSGLISDISALFIDISNKTTYPIFTMLSAGIINIFVPSGGGQWAVQGPILVQASQILGADLPKSILALAYGDQLTNMLQPFWALPLLGITGLKAKEILPYALLLMFVGTAIYLSALLLF